MCYNIFKVIFYGQLKDYLNHNILSLIDNFNISLSINANDTSHISINPTAW